MRHLGCMSNAPDRQARIEGAAKRALAEAKARRAEYDRRANERPAELGGPKGEEPTRYGDWEKDGVASDF